ncbi:MAG: hypothetical protein HY290_24150 [Planctomycetia bacterium]|nr:hypothetical protein [Planctomycetia bacterium]
MDHEFFTAMRLESIPNLSIVRAAKTMHAARPTSGARIRFRTAVICRQTVLTALALGLAAVAWPSQSYAQTTSRGRYFPLDQTTPPGVAGHWAGVQRGFAPVMQPVKVELPGGGQVSYYTTPAGDCADAASNDVVALRVGSAYRLKISDLPGFEGAELYPTVELIDRLHPPRGREIEFAIPIALTADEIALALEGRLVTKVVYLEQPDRADPVRSTNAARSHFARPRENLLALADVAGRPMVIVRLGGRAPDAGAAESGFFGTGAPVQVLQQAASSPKVIAP